MRTVTNKKLPPMLMKSGQGNINLSMCTVALRNKGGVSQEKEERRSNSDSNEASGE